MLNCLDRNYFFLRQILWIYKVIQESLGWTAGSIMPIFTKVWEWWAKNVVLPIYSQNYLRKCDFIFICRSKILNCPRKFPTPVLVPKFLFLSSKASFWHLSWRVPISKTYLLKYGLWKKPPFLTFLYLLFRLKMSLNCRKWKKMKIWPKTGLCAVFRSASASKPKNTFFFDSKFYYTWWMGIFAKCGVLYARAVSSRVLSIWND